MQIHVRVDYQEAIRRGFAVDAESVVIDVSSEDLAGLSGEDRKLLATAITTRRDGTKSSGWYFVPSRNNMVAEPTLRGIVDAIREEDREMEAATSVAGAWIEEHGSKRLKSRWRYCRNEPTNWLDLYHEELIEKDYPGWTDKSNEIESRDLDQSLGLLELVKPRWPEAYLDGCIADGFTVCLDRNDALSEIFLQYRWPDNK